MPRAVKSWPGFQPGGAGVPSQGRTVKRPLWVWSGPTCGEARLDGCAVQVSTVEAPTPVEGRHRCDS